MSSNISEINENSSESPDLVLSSTLNTYTTDLINFQSAQIEIPPEKEERMELMILNSVLIHLYSSPSPVTRENEDMSCQDDLPRQPKDRCKDYMNLLTLY